MYSQVTLIGRLTNDPEMRYTPSGQPVASFGLAINKTWTNAEGQKQEKATFWRISCWRKLAETASQYLTKGSKILVIGEDVESQAYTNKAGEAASNLQLTANVIRFLDSKSSGERDSSFEPAQAGEEDRYSIY